MRKLKIAVIDLVTKGPTRGLYPRIMHPNLASIMPQVIAVWCEEAGHEVTFVCYTGLENLLDELPHDVDLVFIGAFTHAAQLSYAISNMFRQSGAATVLGGPHARCYPDDALKYFDYVLGFTDRRTLDDVLQDCEQHRPRGVHLTAREQPSELPSIEERWPFIESTIRKAPTFKIVPHIGSLGCPYTCNFCIDATVGFKPLSFEQLGEDLRFLLTKLRHPRVGWHDPNFGVRFNDYMDAIEDAVPPNRIDHLAESSLSLLSEPHLRRLHKNGFKVMLSGIESWYDFGNKSKTGRQIGEEKLRQVHEHVDMAFRYIPLVGVNFVLGLDADAGAEPFGLTKQFLDLVPFASPAISLLSAFGEAAPLNLELQRAGRVLPVPFHFLNNCHTMNVKPKHYDWIEFYDHVIDLHESIFSWSRLARGFAAQGPTIAGWYNVVRGISSERLSRIRHYRMMRQTLKTNLTVRRFFEGETTEIPRYFRERVKQDLRGFWEFLPEGALEHDPNAYLKKWEASQAISGHGEDRSLSVSRLVPSGFRGTP